MSIPLNVPTLPESVSDATLVKWYKQPGEAVQAGETLADLETDKVMLEIPAAEDGVLVEIIEPEGAQVVADQLIAKMEAGAAPAVQPEKATAAAPATETASDSHDASPAVRRLLEEHQLDASQITGTGKGGRLTKQDVENHLKQASAPAAAKSAQAAQATAAPQAQGPRFEERVPVSRLRARIAERLLDAQHNAALLTTFNEVNMKPVMDLRAQYKDLFEKTHDTRLGFMSFFVKAAVAALKKFPDVNACLDNDEIIYHGYQDVGVAVSTPRGLVVPVLRNAEAMSMADVESGIRGYAEKARDGKITLEEMTGGTFTITNGGVFGSMLSTPIINPPQSAILGMHNIVKRPVVENDEIVIRPMMYLALTYDHRIIDGATSVRFLVTIKEMLEDPARLILDV